MRLVVLACVACALFSTANAFAAPLANGRLAGLDIRVEGGGWGGVSVAAIEETLYAVADVLLPQLPRGLTTPIVVTHTDGYPVTLYERGANGEYLVHLHASGTRWHLYVYEFAHELTHVVSNYGQNVGPETTKRNQWFEESVCEAASLFVLERLAATWAALPAGDELAARAAPLRSFFDLLVSEKHRLLPAGHSFAAWLADNEEGLRDNPYLREKDDLVARRLLPLFERNPASWEALCYLNLDATDNDTSLPQYLAHWYRNAPAQDKPFVGSVFETLAAGAAGEVASLANAAPAPSRPPASTLSALSEHFLAPRL
ncbi:MAG: hypothetical protein PHY45_10905 [Rhodocyclaceae bacterium]|nr:hypothetical protein [Rhodocyclaceae bacterium]